MQKQRRKAILRIVERAALGVALLDALIYFAAVRPFRSHLAASEQSRHLVLRQILDKQVRVIRLEAIKKSLPEANERLTTFLHDHVPERRRGFSKAARLVRVLTDQSHVQLSSVSYKLRTSKDEPLDRLGLDITVQGPFSNVLNFAHALETSGDLVLVRNFSLAVQEGNTLSLRVGAELYLTP